MQSTCRYSHLISFLICEVSISLLQYIHYNLLYILYIYYIYIYIHIHIYTLHISWDYQALFFDIYGFYDTYKGLYDSYQYVISGQRSTVVELDIESTEHIAITSKNTVIMVDLATACKPLSVDIVFNWRRQRSNIENIVS